MVSCMGFYFGIIHLRLDAEESSNQKNQQRNNKKLPVSSQMTGKVSAKQDRKFSDNNHFNQTPQKNLYSHIQTHQQSLVGSLDVHSHMLK